MSLFIVFIINSTISSTIVHAGKINKFTDYAIRYKVDFDPPSIVLDCLSFFYLNVTIKRSGVILPSVLCVSVFLYIPSENHGNKISRIGFIPIVYFPASEKEIKVSVPCVTSNRLFDRLMCLRFNEKEDFKFREGYVGVSVSKLRNTGMRGLILGKLWKCYYKFLMRGDIWKLITSNVIPAKFLTILALSRLTLDFKLYKELVSPFTVWKKVKISSPFVCSDQIKLYLIDFPNQTDEEGNFNVTIKVENNLKYDIITSILVDFSSEPFINTLLPVAIATINRYNAGHREIKIPAGEEIVKKINCSFPSGGFEKKDYTVRVECAAYIPIGNSNQFGIYTFGIRWLKFVKPHYKVNATVQDAIKDYWYNLPIFTKENSEFLLVEEFNITYSGKEQIFTLKKGIEKIGSELKIVLILMFILILALIVIALIGYRTILKERIGK